MGGAMNMMNGMMGGGQDPGQDMMGGMMGMMGMGAPAPGTPQKSP